MRSRSLVSEILKFLFSGGIAALANALTGIVFRLVLFGPFSYGLSVAAGFIVGTIVSFVLNRSITFKATGGNLSRQLTRYISAAIFGVGLAIGLASALLWFLHIVLGGRLSESVLDAMAHVGAIGLSTVYNFIAIKYFAFRAPSEKTSASALSAPSASTESSASPVSSPHSVLSTSEEKP